MSHRYTVKNEERAHEIRAALAAAHQKHTIETSKEGGVSNVFKFNVNRVLSPIPCAVSPASRCWCTEM